MRAPGSGLYRGVAEAAEELWAAVIGGSRPRQLDWADEIDHLYATEQSGLPGAVLRDWYREIADGLGLDARSARRESPDTLGDASARLNDGTTVWFELKTQTKKTGFGDLTQTDWVRDATTATAWLCHNDRAVAGALSPSALRELQAPRVPTSWDLEDAWLGDLLLLTDEAKRVAAAATTRAGMAAFAQRKFLVHTTGAGARVIRLSELTPVAAILQGHRAQRDVHHRAGAAVGVWVTAGRYPSRSDVHFSYNMDYGPGVLGRHKLHGPPLARDPWIVSGRATRRVAARTAAPAPAARVETEPVDGVATSPPPPIDDGTWVPEGAIDIDALVVGQLVRHRARGQGRITSIRVLSSGAEIGVMFDAGGETTIATGYNTLQFRISG